MGQKSGQSDQFDDLIMDPENAEGPEIEDDQGYENTEEDEGGEDKDTPDKEELETFDNIDSNRQTKALDDKEDDEEDKKGEKDESKKDDDKKDEGKKEEKEDESKPDNREEDKKDEDLKTLKLIRDGKKYEVPQDATVRVKVNGKNEFVPLSELRDGYAGKVAWDKKHIEIGERAKELEEKLNHVTQKDQILNQTVTEVKTSIEQALKEGGSPMEAVGKIVDMLQVDSYDFNKALFESLTEELRSLEEMDEYERRAYWLEKKTNHLEKRHESFAEKQKQTQAQQERLAKVDQLRDAHGVSEEDFVSAYEQLSQNGKQVTPEQVIQYAASLPLLETAEELLNPYEDQLSDDEFDEMMARLANTMKTDKSITKDDLATYLAETFELEEAIGAANSKAGKMEAGRKEFEEPKGGNVDQNNLYSNPSLESFSDFDY